MENRDKHKPANSLYDHLPMLKRALISYKKNLERSIEIIDKKLGIKIPTPHTTAEIRYVERLLEEIN